MLSRIVTTPSVCPVPIDILRRHAAVDTPDDDDLLTLYAETATELAENYTGRIFLQKSITYTLSNDDRSPVIYPMGILLQSYLFGSLSNMWLHLPSTATSIDSVSIGTWGTDTVGSWSGNDTVLVANQDYQADVATDPARIRMLSYSAFNYQTDHLSIQYTSGYGQYPRDIPAPIRQAIMVLVTRLKEHRGDGDANCWCSAAENLLAPYKIWKFAGSQDLFGA